MANSVLVIVALAVPALALVLEHVGNVRISERHHSHHDTYVVPVAFTRGLVIVMVFMGALGLLLDWLCLQGAFSVAPRMLLGFSDAFLVTCFILWALIRRYRVSTFADSMVVTPFVGPSVWVRYSEIDRLEWRGLRMESGFRSLDVWVDGKRRVRLSGIVDVEQIIMSIDRFDLLPRTL